VTENNSGNDPWHEDFDRIWRSPDTTVDTWRDFLQRYHLDGQRMALQMRAVADECYDGNVTHAIQGDISLVLGNIATILKQQLLLTQESNALMREHMTVFHPPEEPWKEGDDE
jgi:hypothetical protein